MKKFKYGIVLTGGIATGKSTVGSLLKMYGYKVIEADDVAHIALQNKFQEIVEVFGECIIDDQGTSISRKKLGAIVFEDQKLMYKLEEIVHPFIVDELYKSAEILENFCVPFFVDIPIYFEKKNLFDFFESNVLIYAPRTLQEIRLQKRNQLTLLQAQQRIALQNDIEEKKAQALYIINNVGSLAELQLELERYLETLKEKYVC